MPRGTAVVENIWAGNADDTAAARLQNTPEMAINTCATAKRMAREVGGAVPEGAIDTRAPEEQAKIAARMARFGAVSTSGTAPAVAASVTPAAVQLVVTEEELQRRAARAARFGMAMPAPSVGAEVTPALDEAEEARRVSRAARFGGADGEAGEANIQEEPGDGMEIESVTELPEIDTNMKLQADMIHVNGCDSWSEVLVGYLRIRREEGEKRGGI